MVGDKLDAAPALGPGHTLEVSRSDTEPTQQVSVPPAPKLTLLYSINYLVPLAFSLTAKYETLNGHFTLNFHYYEQRFQLLGYILIVEPVYRIFLLYHVNSRDVRKRSVIRRILRISERTADLS